MDIKLNSALVMLSTINQIKNLSLTIATCLLFLSNQSISQDIKCDDLVAFRDKELLKIWESKQEKYRISKDAVADIANIKRDLLYETQYANSDVQPILLTIKTLANVIEDVVGLASPQGKIINLAKQAGEVSVKSEKVYKLIKSGGSKLEAAMSEDVEKTLAKQALMDLAGAQSGLAFFVNIHDNIKSFQDFSDMRSEIKSQLAQVGTSFNRYNNALNKPYSAFQEINNYKNYIDSYLKENCKTEKKEVLEIGSTDNTAKLAYIIGIATEGGFTRSSYCSKSHLVIHQEVKYTNNDYKKIWEDMSVEINKKYPSPKYQFPIKTVVQPGNCIIVYSYKLKKPDCDNFAIAYSKAKTFEQASKEIEYRMKGCKDCYSYSEIERWPRPK